MKTCCVYGCSGCMYDGVSLFTFPKDGKLRKKWIRQINRANWNPSDSQVVCSRHFEDREIEKKKKPRLRKGAYPTLRLKGTPAPMRKRKPPCSRAVPEEVLTTPMDESRYSEGGRMTPPNLHLGGQWCNTFVVKEEQHEVPLVSVCEGSKCQDSDGLSCSHIPIDQATTVVVKKEPEEMPPATTDEGVPPEDPGGLSTFTLHLEGGMRDSKGDVVDKSAVSTFKGFYQKDARSLCSFYGHLVQGDTSSVVVKQEPEEILATPTDCTLHLEKKGGSFAVKEDYAETDFDDEERFDSENDHSSQCDGSDTLESNTDQHQKEHQCRFCSYTSCRTTDVTRHERTHTRGKPFGCRSCSKAFTTKFNLLRHERVHTREKPFKCSTCGSEFSQQHSLEVHKRTHTGEQPFRCHVCHKALVSKANLLRHERFHTGERPFRCLTCQKAFAYKCHLASHERVHTGERPFICQTCPKAFTFRSHLVCHERIHTGEKPFTCQTCHKAFVTSSDLARHETVHTGERPFKCKTCEKAFSYKSSLNKHEVVCCM